MLKSISKRIYIDYFIPTTKRKRTMKKLIIDACTKTAFYSKGSWLGPVLANIIMTGLEGTIVC